MKISSQTGSPSSRVRVYRQDSAVSKPSEETIDKVSIGRRLDGPRMEVVTGRGEFKASADKDGNYLYPPGSKKFNQVQAFVSAQKTLDLFEGYAERQLPWAFERDELAVIPHAGDGKNAYYARWNKSIAFYSFASRPLGKTVYVAQSADVVSHETGHAVLDGMKPQWGKTFDRETKSMHEAFGDCAAMLLTLSRPGNRAQALEETGGDLRKSNVISNIAEEFGTAVRAGNRNPDDDRPYLRNANNSFVYQPPSELPRHGSREELSAEPHSFCQIFTRAFYESLVGLYEQNCSKGMNADEALRSAGDTLGTLLTRGLTMVAPNRARFAGVALAMLRADRLKGGQHQEPLCRAFLKTQILDSEQLKTLDQALPQGKPEEVLSTLGLEGFHLARTVSDDLGFRTLEFSHTEEATRSDFLGFSALPTTVDVESGVSLTYDSSGALVHVASHQADAQSEWDGLPSDSALSKASGAADLQLVRSSSGYKLEKLPIFQD